MKKKKKSAAAVGTVLQPLKDAAGLKPWADYLAGIDPWKFLGITSEYLMSRWTEDGPWRIFSAADPKSSKTPGFDFQDGIIVFSTEGGRTIVERVLQGPIPAELGDGGYIQVVGTKVRQKGVGKYLLSAAERVIQESQPRVFLYVSERNAAAQRFYKSLGYEEVAVAKNVFKEGNNEILMTKKLGE